MNLAASILAAMAAVGSAQVPAAQTTVQQDFEAATKLLMDEKFDQAAMAFGALEQRLANSPNSRSMAAVRLRRGDALVRLGRIDEAAKELELGLANTAASDPSLTEDRMIALLDLAAISDRRLEFAKSRTYYASAEKLADDPLSKARAFAGLIRAMTFVDATAAIAEADRALAWFATQKELGRDAEGELLTLKGRALLNAGRFEEAHKLLRSANSRLGGMTLKVSQADVAARGDLSLAALLSGNRDRAREYLAYTGAGRLEDQFIPGNSMRTPRCGEDGIAPGDVAVVQLSIGDDGTVVSAMPIYASNGSSKAIAFARKAMKWSWDAEEVKKIRPFFRSAMRLEMRCTNEPEAETAASLLARDFEAWAVGQGFGYGLGKRDVGPADYDAASAELAAREKKYGAASAALLPVLARMSWDGRIPSDQQLALNQRGLKIARAVQAPAAVIAIFGMGEINNAVSIAWTKQAKNGHSGDFGWKHPDYSPLLSMPEIARDKRVSTAVRLTGARAVMRGDKGEARMLLEGAAVSTPPGDDPISDAARATLAALKGEKVGPVKGAGDNGCPLAEVIGPMVRSGASSDDFPREAMTWGFEGWASVEHSVTPDGKAVGGRTLIAHPPFVFGKAAEEMLSDTRFLAPSVPLTPACAINRLTVRFKMGSRQ